MFVVLSKILDLALSPLSWAGALAALSFLLRRRPRAVAWASGGAVAVLLTFSTKPVPNLLARWAESSAQKTMRPEVTYDAAIVLGGCLNNFVTARTGQPEYDEAVDRVLAGFDLVRSGRVRHVLFSAGDINADSKLPREAVLEVQQLERWGIPAEQLVAEPRSRNTHENAEESAKIVRERGWQSLVLITSAAHMKRALECFHAVGLAPDTLPVDYRSDDQPWRLGDLLPRASNLSQSTDVIRELAGRVIYRVMGYAKP